jgi:DNA-binding transcriptional MocR family regulator
VLVIEDDHAGPIAGTPAFSVCGTRRTHWVVVRSVSKSLGPDLRLAVLSGDPTTIARIEGRQLIGTGWVSHVLQRVVATLWADRATATRIRHARRDVRAAPRGTRRRPRPPRVAAHGRSGLNVWVLVPEGPAGRAGACSTPGSRWSGGESAPHRERPKDPHHHHDARRRRGGAARRGRRREPRPSQAHPLALSVARR